MNYLLGIDFGGGASKATLLRTDGVIFAEHTVEYPTLHPGPGWCEQRPEDWINALCENTKAIFEKSGIRPSDVLAVAIDSATHTFLPCDAQMRPLRDAIHWTDSRSRLQAQALHQSHGDLIYSQAMHKPDTIWTLPQLVWMNEQEPDLFGQTSHLFFEKDYIRHFLTGVYCTDYIEAQGSMLFDYNKMDWSEELVRLSDLKSEVLPPLVKPTDVIGAVTEAAAQATGLAVGTPVICGTTDTVMEVFASGAVKPGDITVKLATAGRICVITEKPHPHPHLINYSHVADGLWYPGTATKSCAASYRWYRDTFGGDYPALNSGAEAIAPGCDGLMFHPYLNGELTPYGDPMLCGSFTGIRAGHTKAHFTRAVMEGVSMSLLDSKRVLDECGIRHNNVATLIGGGAKGDLWCQITADMLGMTLHTTRSSDSSLGSAMLAGVASGVFHDYADAVSKCITPKAVYMPNPESTAHYAKHFEVYRRIHDALAPIYAERDSL